MSLVTRCTVCLSHRLRVRLVAVNTVRNVTMVVGMTETEQSHLHYGDEEGIAAVGATVPLGRMAVPTDIGHACLYDGQK